jgi:hypothetical protein
LVLSLVACGGRALAPRTARAGGDAGTATDAGGGKASCTFKGFANPVAYATSGSPRALITADLTGDGRLDLLVAGSRNDVASLELLTNTGSGVFSLSALPVSINPSSGALAADFNGDGIIDLASQSNSASGIDLATNDGVLAFDFGTGNGAFAAQSVTLATPQTSGRIAAGDFDGDGRPDLAFAGYDYVMAGGGVTADGRVSLPGPEPTNFALDVFPNAGQGGIAAPKSYPKSASLGDLVTGDFDGDGHLDIAELASTAAGMVSVFYNAGDGTFRTEASFGPNPDWSGFGLGVADFNGDGIDDLATTTILRPNASDEAIVLEVFTGARNGSLAVATTELTAIPDVYQVATGDFNGDGKPDVALVLQPAGRGGSAPPVPVAIYANQGDGSFAAPLIYYLRGPSELLTDALTAGDFNGDGVTDLAVATTGRFSPYPTAVNVLLSQCE